MKFNKPTANSREFDDLGSVRRDAEEQNTRENIKAHSTACEIDQTIQELDKKMRRLGLIEETKQERPLTNARVQAAVKQKEGKLAKALRLQKSQEEAKVLEERRLMALILERQLKAENRQAAYEKMKNAVAIEATRARHWLSDGWSHIVFNLGVFAVFFALMWLVSLTGINHDMKTFAGILCFGGICLFTKIGGMNLFNAVKEDRAAKIRKANRPTTANSREFDYLGSARRPKSGEKVEGGDSFSQDREMRKEPETSQIKEPVLAKKVIHSVLRRAKGSKESDLSSILITAQACEIINNDGSLGVRVKVFAEADPFDVIEAYSAIYWKGLLNDGVVSLDQLCEWLRPIEKLLGREGWCPKSGFVQDEISSQEMLLFSGLTQVSLLYVISHFESFDYPESFVRFYHRRIKMGEASDRYRDISESRKMKDSGVLSPDFLMHLKKAVSGCKIHR